MIKDLLQHKYSPDSQKNADSHRRSLSAQRSVISKLGDPKKNSDRLRFMLNHIKFPQPYNESEALRGHPTQFMKIISFALFVASQSVKQFLYGNGVDPDTVYMNDYRFMQKVFKILVHIPHMTLQVKHFGYKSPIGIDQFFKYGYAEQKMLLCCDVIAVVRRKAKDVRVQRSLSRKRSQTTREGQSSAYSVVEHGKGGLSKRDFVYERDEVRKVARVKALNGDLVDQRRNLNDSRRVQVAQGQQRSPSRLSAGPLSNTNRSLRYSNVQSRYLDPPRGQKSTIQSDMDISSVYKPLRVRKSLPSSDEKPDKPYVTPSFVEGSQDVILQLKQTIEKLNSKFESFQHSIDQKIDTIHQDYRSLNSKIETMQSTKDPAHSTYNKYQTHQLREKIASPTHYSEGGGPRSDEKVNPLKEFTFSEKGQAQRAGMYLTDGFAMNQRNPREDLRDESRKLIESIRKNLDESKKALENYKSEPQIEYNQF